MRKNVLYPSLCLTFLLVSFFSFSQIPSIKWQKSLGGTSEDAPYGDTSIQDIKKTPIVVNNDGYIIATSSYSNNGNVSGNHGNADFWIVRLDTTRNIMWQKSFGGTWNESANEVQHTLDGNYIVGGIAYSPDGDVSGRKDSTQGDGWLIKVSATGTLIWQKCLGGTFKDEIVSVKPTADGGFIILGNTWSNDLDVSGNHGMQDIWLVKVDNAGNIQWQRALGGANNDYAGDLLITSDGGYIVAGATESNDGDITGHHGQKDMWIIKLNAAGNIIWQKCFGGTQNDGAASIKETVDGGYIAAGYTFSTNGDVTVNKGNGDLWVVKMDITGSLVWQKSLGGNDADKATEIQRTADNGFIVCGSSWSNNGDVSGNHGARDAWVIKLDNIGTLQWQKCFGGTDYDGAYGILPINENEFLLTGSVNSNNGDVFGNHGSSDFWLARLGASNTIKGIVYYDQNRNGILDAGEKLINDVLITTTKAGGAENSGLPFGGEFNIQVDTGTYKTTATVLRPYFTTVPSSISSVFTTYFNTASLSFALQPIPGRHDLYINLIPVSPARPGFDAGYQLIYKNQGTRTIATGTVKLIKDNRTDFISASVTPDKVDKDTLTWNYTNLDPFSQVSISITLKLKPPPTTIPGTIIKHIASIDPISGDFTPADDSSVLIQQVTGSYDPNDKLENNNGIIREAQITKGEYLNYTIRFQNVGTDTAFNIVIRDTLDDKVEWSTLQMISSSHDYRLTIKDGNKCTWNFDDIKLADDKVNEPLSHGYVAYRVKPKNTLAVGDMVYNDASIYFDYNLPIETNLHQTLVDNLITLPVRLLNISAKLKADRSVLISWETSAEENADFFEIERSNGNGFTFLQKVAAKNLAQGASYSIVDNDPFTGTNYYRLKMVDIDGSFIYSKVVQQVIMPDNAVTVQISPNPTYGELTIKLAGPLKGFLNISIYDITGKKVQDKIGGFVSGTNYSMPVTLTALPAGIYIAKIRLGSFAGEYKFVLRSK